MQDRYIYPAIFKCDEYGIAVEYPDLPGCLTCAKTLEEALHNAKEALELYLYCSERDGDEIPPPSDIFTFKLEPSQKIFPVEVWMPQVRLEQRNKAVRKNITIPAWLNELAEQSNVNYSHVLQDALKTLLGVTEHSGNKL